MILSKTVCFNKFKLGRILFAILFQRILFSIASLRTGLLKWFSLARRFYEVSYFYKNILWTLVVYYIYELIPHILLKLIKIRLTLTTIVFTFYKEVYFI